MKKSIPSWMPPPEPNRKSRRGKKTAALPIPGSRAVAKLNAKFEELKRLVFSLLAQQIRDKGRLDPMVEDAICCPECLREIGEMAGGKVSPLRLVKREVDHHDGGHDDDGSGT